MSEWADEYFYLPEGDASAGKWTCRPYQVEILNAFSDPEIETITFMKSSRVGYTQMMDIAVGYHIHYDPCPQLVVHPTIEDAQGYSKDFITPMLETVPVLLGKVSEAKSRDKNNTILKKSYAGGPLNIVGANSARGFRRIAARNVYFDEVDGYPPTAGEEGDQIKLGIRRTDDYHNRKIIIGSTPTFKGSRIHISFEKSDQRYYYVPCPFCKHRQVLEWRGFDFGALGKGGTVENPVYVCDGCERGISYKYQRWMVEQGEWIATTPFSGHAGFHIWAAYSYSPKATWSQIVKDFLDSKNNRDELQVWTNTVLGEPFEEQGEKLDWEVLAARREHYPAQVPSGGLFLTCTVDVQKDRLVGEVAAVGRGEECWGIEYFFLMGPTDRNDVWEELARKLKTKYAHESGLNLEIAIVLIDSGYEQSQVFRFCKGRTAERVYAIRGGTIPALPRVGMPTHKNRYHVPLFTVGTDTIKNTIFNRLADVDKPGHGYMHFPDYYEDEYFMELTAEELRETFIRGVKTRRWVRIRKRNEALDLCVYRLAAIELLNPDYEGLEKNISAAAEKIEAPKEGKPEQHTRQPKKGGWANSWKG